MPAFATSVIRLHHSWPKQLFQIMHHRVVPLSNEMLDRRFHVL
jgi:hypothetical protein